MPTPEARAERERQIKAELEDVKQGLRDVDTSLKRVVSAEVAAQSVTRDEWHWRAIIVGMLVVSLGVGLYVTRSTQQRLIANRQADRHSACVRDNLHISRQRLAVTELARTLNEMPLPGASGHIDSVMAALRYRDCSPEGIRNFYDNLPTDPARTTGG